MNTKEIENKWQEYWEKNKTFKTDVYDFSKPKYYALDMFPYPSGVGLHAGHPEGYTATDIITRMKKMQGYNVLHPMGFDSFGLPAEQYAIKTGNHPKEFTNKNIHTFVSQLKSLGFAYDWDRCISTCDPSYYKWTQWIFKQIFNEGLASKVNMPVNWCEELGTVLANDEVIDGKSERGGYPVIRKNMLQWVIDLPSYAQKLLDGLEELDWPESTKDIQRNWIGKSIGANVVFKVDKTNYDFTVFTTRCDTLFGATYCVLSPEHELVSKITTDEYKNDVNDYVYSCSHKSEAERTDVSKEKTGVFTGSYAINPVNNKRIPIWISDYVLVSYGTGAIMAVPAHDERDYAFAKKFNLDIIEVLKGGDVTKEAYVEDGIHVNSGFLDGLNKEDAINKMIEFLKENKCGEKKIIYKVRKWVFARQRYWGEPIPVIEFEDGKLQALEDDELPLELPVLTDYAPRKNGTSPLENASDWVNVNYQGKSAHRETSTMPGSAGSSWYFLRYIDPKNNEKLADESLLAHWLPVDLYIGGPEHAVGHLLYSRMWNNFLYDKGIVPVKEPFKKLRHQGMILGSNGIKMGKRYPEYCVDPNEMIEKYGADTLRLYEMFMGPLEDDKKWETTGIEASRRFLDRVYRMYDGLAFVTDEECPNLDKVFNQTIKKVTEDYETLNFNTAISQMMIFVNSVYKEKKLPKNMAIDLLKLLNPICPHMTEELHQRLTLKDTIALEPWPVCDESKIKEDKVTIAVSVNGKLRATFETDKDTNEDALVDMALSNENVNRYVMNNTIVKKIVIPNKIVNIVVK